MKAIKLSASVNQKKEEFALDIAQEMAVSRREISVLIWENIQEFWKREDLLQNYIEKMNRYYNLADQMLQLMLEQKQKE